jgi:hypothetical protein
MPFRKLAEAGIAGTAYKKGLIKFKITKKDHGISDGVLRATLEQCERWSRRDASAIWHNL